MTPRGTIADIAAVLLAACGALALARQAPPQTDTRVSALIASLGRRYGDKAAEALIAIGEPAVVPLLAELGGGGRAQLASVPLARIGTGETQPHYVMWYGFYEGTTPWRTDPIALAFVFGLRTLGRIEAAFPGRLYEVLMRRRVPAGRREPEAGADHR